MSPKSFFGLIRYLGIGFVSLTLGYPFNSFGAEEWRTALSLDPYIGRAVKAGIFLYAKARIFRKRL